MTSTAGLPGRLHTACFGYPVQGNAAGLKGKIRQGAWGPRLKRTEPDRLLLGMPSLHAIKTFVAAAKCLSFTRAAESLCVTPAAVSRQIKELEDHLSADLFKRAGRAVELTPAGQRFYETARLSLLNIAQAAEAIRCKVEQQVSLTLCCSPAHANLWLAPRLEGITSACPGTEISIITTHDFANLGLSIRPDIFITQSPNVQEGYVSYRLFGELIYPVCSPEYFAKVPADITLNGLMDLKLLDLSPFGRATLAEYVDWKIWLALQGVDVSRPSSAVTNLVRANDYTLLVQLTMLGHGVALGWHHLVSGLIEQGLLVRIPGFDITQPQTHHYLAIREEVAHLPAVAYLRDWMTSLAS